MNKPFLWNFQFTNLPKHTYPNKENLCWERRYFWHEQTPAIIGYAKKKFLNLANLKYKTHQDTYLLLRNSSENLKIRSGKLVLKPLLEVEDDCYLYGEKNKLAELMDIKQHKDNKQLLSLLKENKFDVAGLKLVDVDKEIVCVRKKKFKLEFSRLAIKQMHYASLSIVAENKQLLIKLAERLNPNAAVCDYVTFLKSLS